MSDALDADEPRVRARTISATRGPRVPRIHYPLDVVRPVTRGDCKDGIRPCPWAGCRHNLYLDVHDRFGGLKLNFPHLEVDELHPSCALDVADQGGAILEEVGAAMNLTRERVRQLEQMALDRVLKRLSPQLRRELKAYIQEVA